MEPDLLAITEIGPELWKVARTELEQAALVSVESLPGVEDRFLRFHPTLVPYLSTQLPVERRAVLEECYRERYYALSGYLYDTDTQHPHEARAIALLEMPNLKRAFELTVAAATSGPELKLRSESESRLKPAMSDNEGASASLSFEPDALASGDPQAAAIAVTFADRIAKFLNNFGRWRERDALLARLADLHVTSDKGLTKAEFLMLSQRGDVLWQQGRATEAQQVFRDLLTKMKAGAAYDAAYDHAMTLVRLGRCLAAQGRPAQAIEYHRRALQEFEDLSASSQSAKGMLGKVHGELGKFLDNLGQFDEAQQAYEDGLKISREVDDRRQVGLVLSDLGTLALRRGDLQAAAQQYAEALKTFRALGEPQSEAVVWHQLGMVAQEAKEWDEAERCYRESLKLEEQMNNPKGVAESCSQLALAAVEAGRLDDAERWFLRALEVFERLKDPAAQAKVLNNLANLYLVQNRLDEAELYARRALEIKERLDLSAEPWTTYYILAKIAGARGRTAEVTQWRRKANESRDAFAGTKHQIARILQQFQPVIEVVVAACEGNVEAKAAVEGKFDFFREGNWQIVDAIQRIWAGERDAEALTADIDYNSRAIVLAILALLAGETPPSAAGSGSPKTEEQQAEEEEGMSLQDFLALIVQACRPDAPPGLAEQLHASTRAMSVDPNAPSELRALFSVLNQILSGERAPDLSALPPELADLVQGILGAL